VTECLDTHALARLGLHTYHGSTAMALDIPKVHHTMSGFAT